MVGDSTERPRVADAMLRLMLLLAPALATATSIRASVDGRQLTLRAHKTRGTATLGGPTPLALLLADDACSPLPSSLVSSAAGRPFALLARRGGCAFSTKTSTAVAAGASVLIITDTLTSAYNPLSNATASSMALGNPCIVHCGAGRGTVDTRTLDVPSVLAGLTDRCPTPEGFRGVGCPTSLCAFSSAAKQSHATREVCCVVDPHPSDPSRSAATNSTPSVAAVSLPALYLSLEPSHALEAVCAATNGARRSFPLAAHLSPCVLLLDDDDDDDDLLWDGSSAMVWVLATSVAALAAFLGAAEQDRQDTQEVGEDQASMAAAELAQAATIDSSQAVGFLLMATTGLLTLYFLIQAGFNVVVLLLNVVFVLASATATAQIVLMPLGLGGTASQILALGLSGGWFYVRKGAWAWLLQDALSACICVLFVRTIRLPSLRVAALFLGLFFLYDIFMVFISPSL